MQGSTNVILKLQRLKQKFLPNTTKMLKTGVPKEAVDRQKGSDDCNHINTGNIPVAPPPPLPGNTTSVKRSEPPRKITSGDLLCVVLSQVQK